MMMFRNLLGAAFLALGLAACADTAQQAQPAPAPLPPPVAAPAPPAAPDVSDLVGTRAVPAMRQITARGYRMARVRGLTRYYWHGDTRTCIRVAVAHGRIGTVEQDQPASCRR
ncbi:MAG TPA: hypothetical protein VGM87_25225 [Roseomonas sp.]